MSEQLTVEELQKQVQDYETKLDGLQKSHEEFVASVNEQKEKETEEREASVNQSTTHTAGSMEAVLKAAMIDDEKKRMASVKEAMSHDKDKDEKMANLEQQNTELRAMIESQTREIAGPKLTYLASVYKSTDISEEKLKEYSANWEKMSITELNAEIERVQPFANKVIQEAPEKIPTSPSSSIYDSTLTEKSASLPDNKEVLELFNNSGGMYR